LRERVQEALRGFRGALRANVVRAIECGEFAASTDADVAADFLICAFEGAAVVSRASRSRGLAKRAMSGLAAWLRTLDATNKERV